MKWGEMKWKGQGGYGAGDTKGDDAYPSSAVLVDVFVSLATLLVLSSSVFFTTSKLFFPFRPLRSGLCLFLDVVGSFEGEAIGALEGDSLGFLLGGAGDVVGDDDVDFEIELSFLQGRSNV